MRVCRSAAPVVLAAGLLLAGSSSRAQDAPVWEQRFELKKGDFLHVEVRPFGMDVAVALQCPDGKDVLSVDDREDTSGEELLAFLADADGSCRIAVRPSGARQPDGRVEVAVEGPRAATGRERDRLAAAQALAEGLRLDRNGVAESQRKALPHLERAAEGYRALADRRGEARALLALAGVLMRVTEIDRAIGALTRVQPLLDAGDRHLEPLALELSAGAAFHKGQPDRALELAGQAVQVRRAKGDAGRLAKSLYRLGVYHLWLGKRRRGMALLEETVVLARSVGAGKTEAWALSGLGALYMDLGDYRSALDALHSSAIVLRTLPETDARAWSFQSLVQPHLKMGDYRRAKEYQAAALEVLEAAGKAWVSALRNLSEAASGLGESAEAQRHVAQALEVSRRQGDVSEECWTLITLGDVLSRSGDRPAARARYLEALAVSANRNREVRAEALSKLCALEVAEGNLTVARERCTESLQAQDADDAWAQLTIQHLMARLEGALGHWREARGWAEGALRLRDRLRGTLGGAAQRAMVAGNRSSVDEFYVETLMTLHGQEPGHGLDVEAFEAAERARARSLVELLAASRRGLAEGADPALADRESELRRVLQAAAARHARLAALNADAAELTEAARRVQEAERELLVVENTSRPLDASLTPASLTTIQKEVLDSETLLLVYALGEKRSFLWSVGPSSFATHELPGRAVVEGHVRKAYAALSRPGGRAEEELIALGRLLLGPVAPLLGRNRLAVVADGALQYVPFAALRDPAFPKQPLLVRHEIVGLPSASTAVWLRREHLQYDGNRQVAVLADPVFDAEDARLARPTARPVASTAVLRSAEDVGVTGASLPRLPFSRREATAIARLAPRKAVRLALDFEANREFAADPDLGRYRYLHFATHGFLNSARPELSGLVLSLVDRQGRPQEGFLTAADVFTLKLSSELVVLSGCRTALGQEVRGEGLLGLTRAFLHAGAGSVLASLWRVDDAATAELMTALYRGLLRDGLRPTAALRQAQLRLWQRRPRSDPFYWAAFQIQGSWN